MVFEKVLRLSGALMRPRRPRIIAVNSKMIKRAELECLADLSVSVLYESSFLHCPGTTTELYRSVIIGHRSQMSIEPWSEEYGTVLRQTGVYP